MRTFAFALLLLPTIASARPFTAGVGVGRIAADQDWDSEADGTVQVFGRLGLTSRVACQLELQKIEGSTAAEIRTGTALLVVELGQSGRIVPTMFAGLGIDRASDGYGYSQRGSHIEGGFGLEYRFDGGLTLHADVRLGGRSVDSEQVLPLAVEGDALAIYAPMLIEGEYRSARVGVAVRF